jgi:excisionase family DNA binding protein
LTVEQAPQELSVSENQIRGMLKSGELRGFQLGGRGYLAQSRGSMPFLPGAHGQRASFR